MAFRILGSLARLRAAPPDPAFANGLFQFPGGTSTGCALILLLERSRDELEAFLASAEGRFARFRRTVFVTTCADLRPFHRRALVVELLPALDEVAREPARGLWEVYLKRRQAIILAKWRPQWQLSYGLDWTRYIDHVRDLVADARNARGCL